MNVLSVQSSSMLAGSHTRLVSKEFIDALKKKHPSAHIVERDTVLHPLPHISPEVLGALFTPEDKLAPSHRALLQASDQAVAELLKADIIVIGAPMYNFTITANLKTWIDGIVRSGKTFKYTEKGPIGLIPPGKKAVLVIASGGKYNEQPMQKLDFVEPYLRGILGFLGITDVQAIKVEGTAMGPDVAAAADKSALAAAQALAAKL